MKVIVAKNSGFCKGVRRAVETAMTIPPEGVYLLGEIIHNEGVTGQIEKRGIKVVDTLEEIPDGSTVIFRSHGVPPVVYEECEKRNIKYVDCTCEFVRHIQRIVSAAHKEGKFVVICGKSDHPEVIGLLGWCENDAAVIEDEDADLSFLMGKNICLVAQTTFSVAKFDKIIKIISKLCEKSVEVFKTICYTTIGRQKEAEQLSSQCDAMIVIGGMKSSNTNKLYDICARNCKTVIRLADAQSFCYDDIKNKYFNKVGIVSGASTPDEQTREVLLKMEEKSTEVNATDDVMADVVAKIDNESKFVRGQIVHATISEVTEEGLQILLPFSKKEVLLSKDELDCETYSQEEYASKIGEQIDLMVVELKPSLKLSQKLIKQRAEEEAIISEIKAGKDFHVECTGFNKGGLTAKIGTYSVFVPAKEIRMGYVQDLSKYVGKNLRLRMIEIKTDRKKEIIASQRIILQEEKEAREAAKEARDNEFFDAISEGDIVEGKVERVTAFGAFVSVGGFDCLAHISDLSWTGCKAVTDVLEIGKIYQFKILKIDREGKKVSIGYKQLQPQPWDLAVDKYHEGDVIHGKVVRIVPFGAFVEVEKGIDGLVHVSQISHERIETPATVLNVGDEVDAKIIHFDADAKRLNLSIKALLEQPERKPREEKAEGEEGRKRAPRAAKKEDEELSGWSDSGVSVGTTLGDILANAEKNNK
ncbi:MAG: 4-hydroxy-3-methylbut-2-enyl diphosphate reductase [Candidatus Coproplasma sp.]